MVATFTRHRSIGGDLVQDRVDLGPDAGLDLAADQGPFAQDIEGVLGAEQLRERVSGLWSCEKKAAVRLRPIRGGVGGVERPQRLRAVRDIDQLPIGADLEDETVC